MMRVEGRKPRDVKAGDTLVCYVTAPGGGMVPQYDRITSWSVTEDRTRYVYTLEGRPGQEFYISLHTPMNILVEEDWTA